MYVPHRPAARYVHVRTKKKKRLIFGKSRIAETHRNERGTKWNWPLVRKKYYKNLQNARIQDKEMYKKFNHWSLILIQMEI